MRLFQKRNLQCLSRAEQVCQADSACTGIMQFDVFAKGGSVAEEFFSVGNSLRGDTSGVLGH